MPKVKVNKRVLDKLQLDYNTYCQLVNEFTTGDMIYDIMAPTLQYYTGARDAIADILKFINKNIAD